jgi:nucleoside-diphosphate-sugar epimerase
MTTHHILLTGANGFLGSHILKQLLPHADVTVRAVVRSAAKIDAVKLDFGSYDNLDFVIVPDITAPQAFDDALTNTSVPFTTVIHSASPFLYKAISSNLEFLTPAVEGTTGILKSIKAVAPSVKRVVVTSSFAAVGDLANPEHMKGKKLTENDWNPVTWDEAVNGSRGVAYQESKKFAEVCFVSDKDGFALANGVTGSRMEVH